MTILLNIKKFKIFIEDHSPQSYSVILAIPVILFALGLFMWGIYLYTFGLHVNELLRSQFILTGLCFVLFTITIVGLLDTVVEICNKLGRLLIRIPYFITFIRLWAKMSPSIVEFKSVLYTVIFIVWFLFYLFNIFPSLPLYLGGGQPRAVSLLVAKDNMAILNSLAISSGEGATFQTENLCVIYDDSQWIYIVRSDRIIALKQDLISGFSSLPGPNAVMEQGCTLSALAWSHQGLSFSNLLFETNLENILRRIFGMPQKGFNIISNKK